MTPVYANFILSTQKLLGGQQQEQYTYKQIE